MSEQTEQDTAPQRARRAACRLLQRADHRFSIATVFCHTGAEDLGRHVVCAVVTDEFLAFSAQRGNDLSTARPEFNFPGLAAGDRWCLCAARWAEALESGVAPRVALTATHEAALEVIELADLKAHAVDLS